MAAHQIPLATFFCVSMYGGTARGIGTYLERFWVKIPDYFCLSTYAATEISSTSRSMSGYQRLKMAPNSPLSVRTRVCNNKWAPSLDHCICCFLQKRLLTTSLTVDSTKPVAIASPW